jgi:hypothetical protein
MIRHQLFTLLTLLGCIAPWVTPRHFPLHHLQGATAPVISPLESQAGGVDADPGESARAVTPAISFEDGDAGQRQLAGVMVLRRIN